ncbi:MAG TPA: AAA family ATPase [Vicinamibacterales bacterium]
MTSTARSGTADQVGACERFYGLQAPAFSLSPDLRFVYHSRSHSRALEQVTAALRRREGLIVITGAIGTGKTMLCRALLEGFKEERTFLSVILDPCLTVDDLLYQVLGDFGLISKGTRPTAGDVPEATRHQLVTTLHQFLSTLVPLNAHAVIMIDEAQHLNPAVLEQIRLLSNFETGDAKLLQIVLVGQPELDRMLRRPDLQQLSQRIARRFELQPLSHGEVGDYIARRLSVAETTPVEKAAEPPTLAEFTPPALAAIEQISKGVPRVVNVVCDRALEVGCERQNRTIDRDVILTAARRLKLSIPMALTMPVPPAAAAAVFVLSAVLAGWWLWPRQAPVTTTPVSAARTAPTPAPKLADPPPAAQPTAPASTPASSAAPADAPAPVHEAAASPAARKGDTYDISVAAFRTSKRAIDVASDIAAKGLPVTTRPDSTGTWYLVVVGPYSTADDAEAARKTLAREGFPDTRVSAKTAER